VCQLAHQPEVGEGRLLGETLVEPGLQHLVRQIEPLLAG
jgi:hypothetical protein